MRRRSAIDYVHEPISGGGVRISLGDLIFIDDGAVVVSCQRFELAVRRCNCAYM